MIAPGTLHDVPERRTFPNRDLAALQITEGFDPVATAHDDVLVNSTHRHGEFDHLPARLGDGDVGGHEVPLAGGQSRDELVPAIHHHPRDVEEVLLGELLYELAVAPDGLLGVARDAGVMCPPVAAGHDDGEDSARRDELEGRVRVIRDDCFLCAGSDRSGHREQPGTHERHESAGRGAEGKPRRFAPVRNMRTRGPPVRHGAKPSAFPVRAAASRAARTRPNRGSAPPRASRQGRLMLRCCAGN